MNTVDRLKVLTPEQKKLLPIFRKKWVDIGLDTKQTTKEAAQAAINKMYECGGRTAPKRVHLMSSPFGCALAIAILRKRKAVQVRAEVSDEVSAEVIAEVSAEVRAEVSAEVLDEVRAEVSAEVRAIASYRWWWMPGSFDGFWLAYYDCFKSILGDRLRKFDKLEGLIAVAQEVCIAFTFKETAFASKKPVQIHRDENKRLHREDGPALLYGDGWGLYRWHGVRVPKFVVLEPEKITAELIENERNSEVQRVMIERYGWDRYIADSGAVEIHRDTDNLGHPRVLYEKKYVDGRDPFVAVRVANSTPNPDGTHREYMLPVHHELRPLLKNNQLGSPQSPRTCLAAVASTFGKRAEEYNPEIES